MSRMYHIPLTVSLFFISGPMLPITFQRWFQAAKMNPPSLKSVLRTATAYNKSYLDELERGTYHTQTEGQRKEETPKTKPPLILHLTGLEKELREPYLLR